jgi:TPR repeat protein
MAFSGHIRRPVSTPAEPAQSVIVMPSDAAAAENSQQSKAKIFISYSRKDLEFANRLDAGLKACGFEPLIDRTDIYAFEEWWKRIEDLIRRADTIVFVLSPDAVRAGSVALKEIEFAASLNKRFAPIVFRRVENETVPAELAKLNFIFFDDAARFEQSADQLANALTTDIGWIRRHTDFGEQARRWAVADMPGGLLLRSPVLEQAERWIAERPTDAPTPTEETQHFITCSRQAATRRRNILTGSLAAGLVLALGLAGVAYWQRGIAVEQQQIAQRERDRAVQAEQTATEQKEIAQQQRDRAEKTLHIATEAANKTVFDLAQQFRDRPGIPLNVTRSILDRAREMQRQLTESGETAPELKRSEASALGELVITLREQGDLTAALAAAERGRELMEQAIAANPGDPLWQQNLEASYSRLGDVLRASGKGAEALAAYRKEVEIAEKRAAANPDDMSAHSGLAYGLLALGDALKDSGDREEALAAYRRALAVREKFGEPQDGQSQWRLANVHDAIGEVLRTSGREEEALGSFRSGLELMKKAVVSLPDNVRAQGDLAGLYRKVGMTLLARGRTDEAIEAHLADVRIGREIAASDPANAQRQMNLASSYQMYYNALEKAGRRKESAEVLQQLVAIRERVATDNPQNLTWQGVLAAAYVLLGDSLVQPTNREPALVPWRKGLAIMERLTATYPEQIDWQHDLDVVLSRLGDTFRIAGQFQEALKIYERQVQIAERMIARDPDNSSAQRALALDKERVAWMLFALGRVRDALPYADEAMQMKVWLRLNGDRKNESYLYFRRAIMRVYAGRLEEAVQDMETAISLNPDDMYYPLWLHIVRSRLGTNDEVAFAASIKNYDLSEWPGPLIAFYLGQAEEQAVRKAAVAAEKETDRADNICDTDFYVGIHQVATGSQAEGRRLLQSTAEHCPAGAFERVYAALELKRLDGLLPRLDDKVLAIANCDRLAASNLDPERPVSVPGISVAELKPNLAVPACEAALKVAPDDRRIVFQLGRAYAQAENYEKARELYERADALGHALATNNLGALYADGKGVEPNLAEAHHLYEKAARAGVTLAMSNVGFFFERGQGGPKDSVQARYWYEKAAEGGIAYAAYRLGLIYQNGDGVEKDLREARRWYEKAAEGGHGRSMMEIGFLYERGEGVPVDYAKAREWYEKGAAAGDGPSMGNLGALYTRGWGVPQDYTMARKWYERAAAAGNYVAMNNLGLTYETGREVPVDYATARSWYEKSATKGYAPAMLHLGLLYENGHGVTRDLDEAARWYQKAAAKGDKEAEKNLARLREVASKKE